MTLEAKRAWYRQTCKRLAERLIWEVKAARVALATPSTVWLCVESARLAAHFGRLALGEQEEPVSAALRLAKEATNGLACYAKRQIEHTEIARLHGDIAALEVRHD